MDLPVLKKRNVQEPKEHAAPDDLPWATITWWLALIVAVLAIPSVGLMIAVVTQLNGTMSILVFAVACWASAYFGMHLMKHHPSMRKKIDFTKRS